MRVAHVYAMQQAGGSAAAVPAGGTCAGQPRRNALVVVWGPDHHLASLGNIGDLRCWLSGSLGQALESLGCGYGSLCDGERSHCIDKVEDCNKIVKGSKTTKSTVSGRCVARYYMRCAV